MRAQPESPTALFGEGYGLLDDVHTTLEKGMESNESRDIARSLMLLAFRVAHRDVKLRSEGFYTCATCSGLGYRMRLPSEMTDTF